MKSSARCRSSARGMATNKAGCPARGFARRRHALVDPPATPRWVCACRSIPFRGSRRKIFRGSTNKTRRNQTAGVAARISIIAPDRKPAGRDFCAKAQRPCRRAGGRDNARNNSAGPKPEPELPELQKEFDLEPPSRSGRKRAVDHPHRDVRRAARRTLHVFMPPVERTKIISISSRASKPPSPNSARRFIIEGETPPKDPRD